MLLFALPPLLRVTATSIRQMIFDGNINRFYKKYRRRFEDSNPQNAWRIFRFLSTKISARLYFVYCLRNFVCEEAKKTQ